LFEPKTSRYENDFENDALRQAVKNLHILQNPTLELTSKASAFNYYFLDQFLPLSIMVN